MIGIPEIFILGRRTAKFARSFSHATPKFARALHYVVFLNCQTRTTKSLVNHGVNRPLFCILLKLQKCYYEHINYDFVGKTFPIMPIMEFQGIKIRNFLGLVLGDHAPRPLRLVSFTIPFLQLSRALQKNEKPGFLFVVAKTQVGQTCSVNSVYWL